MREDDIETVSEQLKKLESTILDQTLQLTGSRE